MQYVNFVYENGGEATLYTGPVPDSDAAYLRKAAAHLRPLPDDEYMKGPACIAHTLANFSYVLDDQDLYWCVEWSPGLLVLKMVPNKDMEWVALRSPIPDFGGRQPLPDDGNPDEYEHDDNPQYNLIFTSWDAQFDKQKREWGGFVPADSGVQTRFDRALARVIALDDVIEAHHGDESDAWLSQCGVNLENWCGEGIRLSSAD